jgi:hypothetical protein
LGISVKKFRKWLKEVKLEIPRGYITPKYQDKILELWEGKKLPENAESFQELPRITKNSQKIKNRLTYLCFDNLRFNKLKILK